MFKRSILAAAVATVAVAAPAQADIGNVDLYGQVAVSVWSGANWDDGGQLENESRFGLRGSKELARGPKLFWQLEGGNVGNDGGGSGLGVRDTFVGFEGSAGKVRIGRMLTPAYQIVDWPYSGISAGNVFDSNHDITGGANYDRQSQMIRYDSQKMGGFSFSLAGGRGNNGGDDQNNFWGASAHYSIGPVAFHAGYEGGSNREVSEVAGWYAAYKKQNPGQANPLPDLDSEAKTTSDTQLGIIGFEANFENGLGFYGAYKAMEAKHEDFTNILGDKQKQSAYSLGTVYNTGDWQFKVAYAANQALKVEGGENDGSHGNLKDTIISGQALYFLDDSAVTYVRVYQLDRTSFNAKDSVVSKIDKETAVGVGIEYYF